MTLIIVQQVEVLAAGEVVATVDIPAGERNVSLKVDLKIDGDSHREEMIALFKTARRWYRKHAERTR